MSAPFEITVFSKANGPLTKRISLAPDGSVKSDGSACRMANGSARRFPFSDLSQYSDLLIGLRPNEATVGGALRLDLPDEVRVVTKRMLNDETHPGIITRSKDYIDYRPGAPALAPIDFDLKGMPPAVAATMDAHGGLWPTLVSVCPSLADVARIERASTSAGLFHAQTGEPFNGSGGRHVYVHLTDGSDIERFLKTLHQRCWLAGLGWFMVGAAGQLLERSIVDRVCGTPERFMFEGPPILVEPIAQDLAERRPVAYPGKALDSVRDCPPLGVVERSRLNELLARETHRLASERARAREIFIDRQSRHLAARGGMDLQRARAAIERQCDGVLFPFWILPFDDPELEGKTVADVLANPAGFEGETLADPVEGPEYGPGKAIIMRRADGSVWINSFAHGGATYELRQDYAAVRAELEKTAKDDVVDTFVRLVLAADLTEAEIEQLKHLAASLSGVGVRALAATLKSAREQQEKRKARQERERRLAERHDPRPQLPAPASKAPWLPIMNAINEVLAASTADEPPTRDFDGFLNQCRSRRAPGLHSLTSSGANDAESDKDRIPAPEQLRLARLDEIEAAELIERHIEHVELGEFGPIPVHLDTPFVKHFYKRREDPALPRVYIIIQMPLVLPNGEILLERGLNREMNAIFRIPKELQPPQREDCNASKVSEAMRFLTDDWLADVSATYAGKCNLIALAGTIIERALLPLRPGFFVSGGKRGGGKTTALNMVSMATLGTVAAAAAWSPNEEERRKALLSYFLEDDPFVVFDNIKRGATIDCPHVSRALTAQFVADRILGASERRIVPITTVFAWTGNKIAGRADISSRSLHTFISVDRPDPENREFRHSDPIGWTLNNRGKILNALYTILLGNPRRNQDSSSERSTPPTRFKDWWELVGSAIEHAAKLCAEEDDGWVADRNPGCPAEPINFSDLFRENEDEESAGLAELLAAMQKRWPSGFMPRTLAAYLAPDDTPPHEQAREMQSCLERAGGKALRPVSPSSVTWALKKLTDAPVELDQETVLVLRCAHDRRDGDTYKVEQLKGR
jgi:hypothetical protein